MDLRETRDDPIYDGIASPRVLKAMYEIVGPVSKLKKRWGTFLISFPEHTDKPSPVSTDWHPEVGKRPDLRVWRPPFLLTYALLSSVRPRGGGTYILEGSHRLVVNYFNGLREARAKQSRLVARFGWSHPYLAELMGKTPNQGDRERRFMNQSAVIDGVKVRVVELTGEPGDVVLWHPALLHARSENRSGTPRFVLR